MANPRPSKAAHSAGLTVYHYPACGTCKKALKWLDQHGRRDKATLFDITQQPPSAEDLMRFAQRAGKSLRSFFNTSGQSYRNGGWKAKLTEGMSEREMAEALAADGKLIKRPVVVPDDPAQPVLVGFREDEYQAVFA